MKYFFASVLFLSGAAYFSSQQALAWGGRGHDTICQSAVQLVQDKNLKAFLNHRPHVMGHLCNVPDIYWKSISNDVSAEGSPAHYISSEFLGIPLKDLPLDLAGLTAKYNGTDNKMHAGKKITDLVHEMGTNWWRANQFYEQALASGKKIKDQSLAAPANSKEQQDDAFPYNKAVYDMMVFMGLMGHFVGDDSQPYHNNDDYDGWQANHGGIHSYYEEQVVAWFDGDLSARIVTKARHINMIPQLRTFIDEKTVLEKMRTLGAISFSEVGEILKLDPMITSSSLKTDAQGVTTKTYAVRKSAEEGQKVFAGLITTQMARSALLLAKLWDDMYVEMGKPDLKGYRSYRYPFTPDFVMPDYYEIKPPVAPTTPTPAVAPTASKNSRTSK